jgi:EAL domain-containing protein (putative c-di-GMP-specific phosphodiesterase class I)
MEISPDFIKTDMVLVRGIDQDRSRQEIVRAMGAIAESIGAQVVAEGIETEGELQALRNLGVRFGQGFLFGAAVRAED